MYFPKIILTATLIVMVAAVSHAAPLNITYNNSSQTDYIYLFITDVSAPPDVDFVEWRALPGGWVTDIQQADTLSATGPMIKPGERFRVRFNERGTFRLQWAEMLNGSTDPVASGSIYYVRGRFDYASGEFDATIPSVPISGTYWLLGSGLVVLIGVRRRFKS